MRSSDNSYREASSSQVTPRTKSSARILSRKLGPPPPSKAVLPSRVTDRKSTARTSTTSSIYESDGDYFAERTRKGCDDGESNKPVLTTTFDGSKVVAYRRKPLPQSGTERIRKLEENLERCLEERRARRIVSDTAATRALRLGRMIAEAERHGQEEEVGAESGTVLGARWCDQKESKWEEDDVAKEGKEKHERSMAVATRSSTGKSKGARSTTESGCGTLVAYGSRRAVSLGGFEERTEWRGCGNMGIKRVSWLGRRKLVEWGMGVNPRMVYATDSMCGKEDGLGGGLTGTVLCRMGAEHRGWDIVQRGQRFVIRVVGSYVSEAQDVVVYSKVGEGRSRVHSRRCGSGFVEVATRAGVACDESAVQPVTGCFGMSAGGRDLVVGEMRWRLGGDVAVERSTAVLLRFGYYFFLKEATGVRLYTTTDTPEHVRLVARRAGDGAIDEQFSATLTYVVVRVAAD